MFRVLSILGTAVLLVSLLDPAVMCTETGGRRNLVLADVRDHKWALSQEKRKEMPIQFATSGTAGSWAIFAMSDPSFTAFSKGLTAGDRFLDIVVSGSEWKSLFFEVLKCPVASEEPRGIDEPLEDWQDRYRERFRQAIPEYPLLARLWDNFNYVSYKPIEVAQLRDECRKTRAGTSNRGAVSALNKIMKACDQASQRHEGLLFVPD